MSATDSTPSQVDRAPLGPDAIVAGAAVTAAPDAQAADAGPRAMHDAGSYARFLAIAVGGLALDLWSKHWAFMEMGQRGRIVIVPHALEFQTMLNKGALFGLGAGFTEVFLAASLFALVLVAWMFASSPSRRWLLHIALGGIFAGALGNMIDRATVKLAEDYETARYYEPVAKPDGSTLWVEFPAERGGGRSRVFDAPPETRGYVRDFLKIPTKLWGKQDLWPWVFNVADMLLVGGVSILAIYLWRDREE